MEGKRNVSFALLSSEATNEKLSATHKECKYRTHSCWRMTYQREHCCVCSRYLKIIQFHSPNTSGFDNANVMGNKKHVSSRRYGREFKVEAIETTRADSKLESEWPSGHAIQSTAGEF